MVWMLAFQDGSESDAVGQEGRGEEPRSLIMNL